MQYPSKQAVQAALEARHGIERQAAFSAASVAICGLGGLGSHIAMTLARTGIGRLHLIDFDAVDLSNLQRQAYRYSQIGMPKTDAMRQILGDIAPYCEVVTDCVRVTEENAALLLARETIICEAFDRPDAKAMLVNTLLTQRPDAYIIAASGMSGLRTGNTIRTRAVTKHFILCGDESSDVGEDGTLYASRVMLCAAHQANTVLQLLAGNFYE